MTKDTEKILLRASLVFPVTATHVWLATKKRKIGAGFLNGVGGGVEDGETPEQSAIREAFEEWKITILPHRLYKVGVVDFHNTTEDARTFTCRVHVFLTDSWQGEPEEGEEMGLPEPYLRSAPPLERMMPADRDWFLPVMLGNVMRAEAWYGPRQQQLLRPTRIDHVPLDDLTRL